MTPASAAGSWHLADSISDVDWVQAKSDLSADHFDNGRTAEALKRSFEHSQYVVFAWADRHVIGMARLLSDGVCNAYLLDVWTHSLHRRQGIGAAMVRRLVAGVPGQHVGWQTDNAVEFYTALGARHQPVFMSIVSGSWLDNEANRLD